MKALQSGDQQFAIAALLHGVGWHLDRDRVDLAPGITLVRVPETPLQDLYHTLCTTTGLDDGEPLSYKAAIVLEPPASGLSNLTAPDSTPNRLCDLIAVMAAGPVGMCRAVSSSDGFRSANWTHELFCYGEQTEFLLNRIDISQPLLIPV